MHLNRTVVFRLNGFNVSTTPCPNSHCRDAIKQYALVHISKRRETVGIEVTDSFCKGVHENWEF